MSLQTEETYNKDRASLMYVLDYDRQVSLIRQMTQLRKDNENWVVYYHHPSTNEMWKSYFPRATKEQRGPKILRTEPVPEKLADRLDDCLESSIEENAIGLGIELSVEPDRWERIIEILEDRYKKYDRKQLKRFIDYLGIERPYELFREIEKDPEQVNLSREKIKKLKRRSKWIRFKRFWYFF